LVCGIAACEQGVNGDDPSTTQDTDADGDGHTADTDCDDSVATVYPGAEELCDGVDNNCDGWIDEGGSTLLYLDADGDGYGDPEQTEVSCENLEGYSALAGDCDDTRTDVHPSAEELCDETDNDCDGEIDEEALGTWYVDADGDGWGDDASAAVSCELPEGAVEAGGDCDDTDDSIHPEVVEVCDGIDNNCDDTVDEDLTTDWYLDADEDGFGRDEEMIAACEQPEGYVRYGGDCDDADNDYYPGAEESCSEDEDTNCDGSVGYEDIDGDGWAACEECNDASAEAYPGGNEICDGLDNDCDGFIDDADAGVDLTKAPIWYEDNDGDGYGADEVAACVQPADAVATLDAGEDCDDDDDDIHPGALEICDDIDNDCDGLEDDDDEVTGAPTWYADTDRDGFGDVDETTNACEEPDGYVSDDQDCDDTDVEIRPGGAEVCDGIDNDCDGFIDDDDEEMDPETAAQWYADDDGDGYGDADVVTDACAQPPGTVSVDTDCDDTDAATSPKGTEVCGGADEDCDGLLDDDDPDVSDPTTWYIDVDGDGHGSSAYTLTTCVTPAGYVATDDDCEDTEADISPSATEVCNDIDDDCDALIDDDDSGLDTSTTETFYIDADGDGYGSADTTITACDAPAGYRDDTTDCDDTATSVNPGALEVCDELDNDCDGEVDGEAAIDAATWYTDADADGWGDADSFVITCAAPTGVVSDDTDCDDTDASVNPGATEICEAAGDAAVDNDCDGEIDEEIGSTWYHDDDGDGYGLDDETVYQCESPSSDYVADGGDCDDEDTAYSPSAAEGCDGDDYNCDGVVDSDADADGYADAACGGDDCDDSDASTLPEQGGGCAVGATCADILALGRSAGDGEYSIDPDGYGTGLDPFDVTCDMTTDGGGWTEIPYASDFAFANYWTAGDDWRSLDDDFSLALEDAQITAIQALSAEGAQTYVGLCESVIHYYYADGGNYVQAIGFTFFDGSSTSTGSETYTGADVIVSQDGCMTNYGEGGTEENATVFEISSPLVPVVNIITKDGGDAGEQLGSPLTDNPAWLR